MSDQVTATLQAEPQPARIRLPAKAVNTHAHVFGPRDRYPASAKRSIEGSLALYVRMLEVLHFERGVLIQPSDYGTDNSALLDALAELAPTGNFRGVVILRLDQLTDAELARLDALGVRAVRFPKDGVGPRLQDIEAIAERIKGSGWHLEFTPTGGLAALVALRSRLEALDVKVVFEQLGGAPDVRLGVGDGTFQQLLAMVRDGLVWAKLSHPDHLSAYPYAELLPFAQALVDANLARCVFATDWPHTKGQEHKAVVDDGFLVDLFAQWVPDEAKRKTILVDNAAALYGFPAAG